MLVVDDDALIRKAVRLTCESEGYAVQEADRGTDVLERIENFHPDIILLDLMLPDLSGFDVCREIRRAGRAVIPLTAPMPPWTRLCRMNRTCRMTLRT